LISSAGLSITLFAGRLLLTHAQFHYFRINPKVSKVVQTEPKTGENKLVHNEKGINSHTADPKSIRLLITHYWLLSDLKYDCQQTIKVLSSSNNQL